MTSGIIPTMVKRRLRLAAVVLVGVGAPTEAWAQVQVQISPGAGAQFAQQAGINTDVLRMQIEDELNRLFQLYRLKDYLRSFGDAQAFTTRGLGVDYGSNVRLVEVGIAANVSVNAEKSFLPGNTRTQPPAGGLGTNLTVMAGLNFGWLGLRPLTLFGNAFARRGNYGEMTGDLLNYGVHAQLKLFGPRRDDSTVWSALLRWGGLDITTGFDYSRLKLALGRTFKRDIPISDGQRDVATVTVDAQGAFEMDLRTLTIPLELTTNVRFLYVLSAYVGMGFDWQVGGRAEMKVDLNGTMTGRSPQTSAVDVGTAVVTARDCRRTSGSSRSSPR
jgi:hypothetical protein